MLFRNKIKYKKLKAISCCWLDMCDMSEDVAMKMEINCKSVSQMEQLMEDVHDGLLCFDNIVVLHQPPQQNLNR